MSNQQDMNLKALVDTPLKKVAMVAFVLTNIGMFAVPAGLGTMGAAMGWPTEDTVSIVGIGFAINEVILFGSIAILGKPLVNLIRVKLKRIFKPAPSDR
ncbi:hypothetical protein [Vibrio hangzhouensis]|uniref:Uncharacterized protein n=1 Tax=Vibrio hangzhouensis TaxID=462991 RepID=A0A1H5VHA3_9VIBR|nr:hypothetical protein [Vibrio hangzhouensis]SEF86188.1 hypothetical protein SAMN04488244_104194 [Vibrio hangzhouensis]